MESNYVNIKQLDGYFTRLFCYGTSHKTVLGNILILHGMTEHHERYLHFIELLNQQGFDVYIYDHRGHGTDKKFSDLGFFAKKDGASLVVNDAHVICNYIKDCGRSERLIVYGHSMGSIILRCLLQQYHDLDGAIVSSTTAPDCFATSTGLFFCHLVCLFRGARKKAKILHKIIFGGKAYTSLCVRTSFDWLTRNNTIVGKYVYDPYCGFPCTNSFYRDLVSMIQRAGKTSNIKKANPDLPIYFLAGSMDPVNDHSKEVVHLHKRYKKLGFTNALLSVYKDARHELLNELNADEVMTDILLFIWACLGIEESSSVPETPASSPEAPQPLADQPETIEA